MSPTIGLPPPEPEICLVHSRASRFKGGTVVDDEVRDVETHERRVRERDGYRPDACPRCAHPVLHVHSYRERRPRPEPGVPPVIRIACVGASRSHKTAHPDRTKRRIAITNFGGCRSHKTLVAIS